MWAKKFSCFCPNCILLFRGTFEQTILEVVLLDFFPVPARFFERGLPKLYSTCPEALFAEFFSQNHINWHCERKKISWFCQNCILLFRGAFEQNNSRLLVLARFFKHGLPKLYSTCPEALFAELLSQNHNNWHWERKKSAGFDRFAFLFSGELLSKKFSFSSPCPILQAWGAKPVFYVSSGTFCGIFFRRIILIGTVSEKIQLVLSELHSTFPRSFRAKQFSFTIPC